MSYPSPLDNASIITEILYTWINPILKIGATRPLEISDIPDVPMSQRSEYAHNLINKSWNIERVVYPTNPYLLRAIWNATKYKVFTASCYFIVFITALSLQPLFVTKILQYVATGHAQIENVHSGIVFSITLGVISMTSQLAANSGFYMINKLGILVRSALTSMIFQKTLKLSNIARSRYSSGDIMTLMSVDIERIWQASFLFQWIWMSFVFMTITVILLYIEIGYCSFVLIIILLLFVYLQEYISKYIGITRIKLAKVTGERTKLTNELLQSIRIIKLYNWETTLESKLNSVRDEELSHLRFYLYLKIINTVII